MSDQIVTNKFAKFWARTKSLFLFERKSFSVLFFLCALAPTLLVASYLFPTLDKSQKSQLSLLVLSSLLFSLGILKALTVAYARAMKREQKRIIEAHLKQIEQKHGKTHEQERAQYRAKIDQLESMAVQMKCGYEHQIDLLQTSASKSKEQVKQLNFEMEGKLDEIRQAYFAFEDLRKESIRLEEDLRGVQAQSSEKLRHKEVLITDYQQTIQEQRRVIEKKQHYIGRLESKVKDLMYEVRSLLQLEEPPSDPNIEVDVSLEDEKTLTDFYLPTEEKQVSKPFDIATQLERYLDEAQKFTGVDHLGYRDGKSPRFLDISQSSYEIDLRRLFDSFKDETSGIVFVISCEERRFLFVNNLVKTLLGYSPEKFIREFADLVTTGFDQWNKALLELSSVKESQTRLVIRSKSGEQIRFACCMGMIFQGPFSNHIIGICSPVD